MNLTCTATVLRMIYNFMGSFHLELCAFQRDKWNEGGNFLLMSKVFSSLMHLPVSHIASPVYLQARFE